MRQVAERYQVFLDRCEKLLLFVAMALMAGLLLVNAVNIIAEQVSGNSLVWVEEIDNLLFTWIVFLGAGVISRHGMHIGVEIVYDMAGPKLRRALRAVYLVLALIVCGVMVWFGAKMAIFVGHYQTSLYLDINMFYYYLAIPVGGVVLAMNSIGAALRDPRTAEPTPPEMVTVL